MIRQTQSENARRRIAVIEMPRPQRARMGSIGQTPAPILAWTTINDSTPDSSDNFMAQVINRQNWARLNQSGTLAYTPASVTPAPNVAPWNSWLQPSCEPGQGSAAAETPAPVNPLLLIFAALGAAASGVYLWRQAFDAKR